MKKTTFWHLVEAVAFLWAALAFFMLFHVLIESLGTELSSSWKYLPFYLVQIFAIYGLFIIHLYLRPVSYERQRLTLLVNGAVMTLLSFLSVLLIAVYVGTGILPSFFVGGVSLAYPLDAFLLSFVYLVAGFLTYWAGRHLKPSDDSAAYRSASGGTAKKIFASIFRPLFVLVALYFAGSLLTIFSTFDYSFSHFAGMASFYLLSALPTVGLGLYEWGYVGAPEAKKNRRLFVYSVSMVGAALLLTFFFFVAEKLDPGFLSESAQGILPADYLKQIAFGPIILFAAVYFGPFVAFFHHLLRSGLLKKSVKAEDAHE